MTDASTPAAASSIRSSPALRRASGRDRAEWFELIDAWGAVGRTYREIADWLTSEQGLSAWWAQKLIVEYEELRGVREPGVRRDGTFSVGVTRSVGASVDRAYAAFLEADIRGRWLPGVELRLRTARSDRSARFDWGGDESRIGVTFAATGEARCEVAVEHERLPSRDAADRAQAFWKDRLDALRDLLEEGDTRAR